SFRDHRRFWVCARANVTLRRRMTKRRVMQAARSLRSCFITLSLRHASIAFSAQTASSDGRSSFQSRLLYVDDLPVLERNRPGEEPGRTDLERIQQCASAVGVGSQRRRRAEDLDDLQLAHPLAHTLPCRGVQPFLLAVAHTGIAIGSPDWTLERVS